MGETSLAAQERKMAMGETPQMHEVELENSSELKKEPKDEAAPDDEPKKPKKRHGHAAAPGCCQKCCISCEKLCCCCEYICCCLRGIPFMALVWVILFSISSGVFGRGINQALSPLGGSLQDTIDAIVHTYFGIMSVVVVMTLVYSFLGTGWCGEKIAHYTDEAFDAGDFTQGAGCCGCMLACCVRCFYCSNVIVLYIMIFAIFLSTIMQVILSFLSGMIFIFVGLLYGVCSAGRTTIIQMCPILWSVVDVMGGETTFKNVQSELCLCDGTPTSSGACTNAGGGGGGGGTARGGVDGERPD